MSRPPAGRLLRAFLNTLAGFTWAVRHERAVQEECLALALGLPLSFFVAAGIDWWLALVGSLLLLLVVELLNTAIEKLADHVAPEHHAIPHPNLLMAPLCSLPWNTRAGGKR